MTLQQLIDEMREDIQTYVESKVELARLKTYEKGIPAGITTAYITFTIAVALSALALLLVAGAFRISLYWAAEHTVLLSALATGFAVMGGLVLLVVLLLLLCRRRVVQYIYKQILGRLLDDMEAEEAARQQRAQAAGRSPLPVDPHHVPPHQPTLPR